MIVKALGTGNANTRFHRSGNFNASYLLEEDGERFLFDCGRNIPDALHFHKIPEKSIGTVYISHGHGDHTFGLEDFAFARYDFLGKPEHYTMAKNSVPKLLANEEVIRRLWTNTLSFGMETMAGFQASLSTFFEPIPLKPNQTYEWCGWTLQFVQQTHIMGGNVIMPTYGIQFTKPGHKTLYIISDSQHFSPQQVKYFYDRADVIIQDCELIGVDTRFEEGAPYYEKEGKFFPWPNNDMEILELMAQGIEQKKWARSKFTSEVHANFAELAGYPSANHTVLSVVNRSKLKLTHYQDFYFDKKDMYGNPCDWDLEAKKAGFDCFLRPGDSFEI